MASRSRGTFLALLQRIRSAVPLTRAEDVEAVQDLADSVYGNSREQEIDRTTGTVTIDQFLDSVPTYAHMEDGLREHDFQLIQREKGPAILAGGFASIQLAFKLSDRDKGQPLEQRHLCACKLQDSTSFQEAWTEIQCLRSVVHRHVIGFFGAFAVTNHERTASPGSYPISQIVILLEYANAGDLGKERERYPNGQMPESGIKYYVRQICSGLKYIHGRGIVHNDIGMRNILLKYNRDCSKTCMICDFGLSRILPSADPTELLPSYFRQDIERLFQLVQFLFNHKFPPSAKEFKDSLMWIKSRNWQQVPQTMRQVQAFKWFRIAPAPAPPFPKTPTPLLKQETVSEIGYLEQDHVSGASREESPEPEQPVPHSVPSAEGIPAAGEERESLMQRTRRRIASGFQALTCLPFRPITPRVTRKNWSPQPSPGSTPYESARSSLRSASGSYRSMADFGSTEMVNLDPSLGQRTKPPSSAFLQVPVTVHARRSSESVVPHSSHHWPSVERLNAPTAAPGPTPGPSGESRGRRKRSGTIATDSPHTDSRRD